MLLLFAIVVLLLGLAVYSKLPAVLEDDFSWVVRDSEVSLRHVIERSRPEDLCVVYVRSEHQCDLETVLNNVLDTYQLRDISDTEPVSNERTVLLVFSGDYQRFLSCWHRHAGVRCTVVAEVVDDTATFTRTSSLLSHADCRFMINPARPDEIRRACRSRGVTDPETVMRIYAVSSGLECALQRLMIHGCVRDSASLLEMYRACYTDMDPNLEAAKRAMNRTLVTLDKQFPRASRATIRRCLTELRRLQQSDE